MGKKEAINCYDYDNIGLFYECCCLPKIITAFIFGTTILSF